MLRYVVITAGGTGKRMQSDKPKQFIELAGKPLLMHTFEAFVRFDQKMHFVLVIPDNMVGYWLELVEQYKFTVAHQIASGGPSRFHSVKSGLRLVPDEAIVAIHDGVRPLVTVETLSRVFDNAAKFGNAIPIIECKDSLRQVDYANNQPLDRDRIRLVQTPQAFQAGMIKKAYNRNYKDVFTDDATVYEASGHRITLVEGNPENMKVTTPEDLIVAEALLMQRISQ